MGAVRVKWVINIGQKLWKLELIGGGELGAILGDQNFQAACGWQVIKKDSFPSAFEVDSLCVLLDLPAEEIDFAKIAALASQKWVILCVEDGTVLSDETEKCGVHDFIRKPIQPTELRIKLRNIKLLIEKYIEAGQDFLTGLPNRRALHRHYMQFSSTHLLHILYLDIDNFKIINDTFGHSFGDEVLREVAQRLQALAEGAFISRMGGDEFVLLFHGDYSCAALEAKATAVLEALQLEYGTESGKINISASIGLLLNVHTDVPLDTQLGRCDQAMYHIKQTGKNQYRLCQGCVEEPFFK